MDSQYTDILQLFTAIASAICEGQIAAVIAPYLLIIFAALTGAGWSLGRRESTGKLSACFYFLRITFTALLLTAAIIKLVAYFIPDFGLDWMIAPVALAIGIIGDDWMKIFSWLSDAAKNIANRILNKKLDDGRQE
jgi:hypothetical protein